MSRSTISLSAVLAGQTGFAVVLSCACLWRFNTDAVAYLGLARHLQSGRLDLAVSGYWGPMLSWLLALFPINGFSGILACKGVMVLSGLLFTTSSYLFFRALRLSQDSVCAGTALVAVAAGVWSVQFITPDLLMAGFMLRFLAFLSVDPSGLNQKDRIMAGMMWGMAYLAKAVAWPLGFIWLATSLTAHFIKARRPGVYKGAIPVLIGFGLLAAPWMICLSLKYGKPMFSSSGPIAHAVVGPPDQDRYHPTFREWHRPESGRWISWEDPSVMPYKDWSPFESGEYFLHQITLVVSNGLKVLVLWFTLCMVWPLAVYKIVKGRGRLDFMAAERFQALFLFAAVIGMSALYLPVYVGWVDQRYFYMLLPVFWTLWRKGEVLSQAEGPVDLAVDRFKGAFRLAPLLGFVPPVVGSFLLLIWLSSGPSALKTAYDFSNQIQGRLQPGPIGGSASIRGERTGVYLACFLGWPWHGDGSVEDDVSLSQSGIRYLVVTKNRDAYHKLRESGSWSRPMVEVERSERTTSANSLILFQRNTQ